MNRREFIPLLGGAAAWPITARAQVRKAYRIGTLTASAFERISRQLRAPKWKHHGPDLKSRPKHGESGSSLRCKSSGQSRVRGIVALVINAFVGAVVLLLILRLVSGWRGGPRWGRPW